MSDKKVFKCEAGQVYLEKVYWDNSKDPTCAKLSNKLSLYSDEKRRMPIYMHIHVSDLFLNAGGPEPRVQKETKIAIDIMALSKDDIVKQKDANNIKAIRDSVEIFAECILDLVPGGKKIDEGVNSGVVSGFAKNKTELMVTKFFNRGGTNANVAYMHDLSFEVQFTDEQYKKLFDKENKKRYLFAWAWTINKQTKGEYKSVSNAEIDSAEKRLEFLKQGEKSYIDGIVDYCNEMIRFREDYLPRHQYGSAGFVDNFPFDEPSFNFLKVENALPFTFFGAGAQFGPIGLCKKDSLYHQKYISKGPDTRDFIVKEGEKLQDPVMELYLDEPRGGGKGAALFGHGLLSDLDEYHSFGDPCFLFKKDSAVLKINSIESSTGTIDYVKDTSDPTKPGPFKSGKCELVFHDYISDYRDRFKDLPLQPSDIVMEQKVFDFKEFETLQVAPEISLTSEDGEVLALINKGMLGYGLIGCCHTDVWLRNQRNKDQHWESHTLVHRPLILMYELERDLTSQEVSMLNNTPISCTFLFGNLENFKGVEYKIPIDTINGVKKGKHAIFLYLISTQPKIEVIISDDTHLPVVDRIAGYGENARHRGFSRPLTGLPSVTLYENQNEAGLFEGNPLVILDDFSWKDIAEKNNATAQKAAAKTVTGKSVGFLTGFIPVVGGFLGSSWDIGVDMIEGKTIDDARKISITKSAMNLFLECLQIVTTPVANPGEPKLERSTALPNFKAMGQGPGKVFDFFALIASIDQTLKSYYNSVAITSSQFLRGVEFGKGEKDSLYLMAVKTIELILNPTALTYGKAEGPKTLAIFMNREVTGEDHPPFNVQFGEYAGLLIRKDKDAEDSVTCYRDSYLQKVTFFQEMLAKDYKDKKVTEYLVELAKRHTGRIALLDKFAKAKMNKKFIESLESKNVCDVMDKKANGGEFTGGHAEMLCMIINLLRYVDAFFVTCPACEHIVSLSWGWCPYHGTLEELKLKDVNGDGKFDDGFKERLETMFKQKTFIEAYQQVITAEIPLFVHWTQFRISRGRLK